MASPTIFSSNVARSRFSPPASRTVLPAGVSRPPDVAFTPRSHASSRQVLPSRGGGSNALGVKGTIIADVPSHDANHQPDLAPLERQVVALSMNDGSGSLKANRFQRVISRLLGKRRSTQLADPRLETLRQYAVLVRLNGTSRVTQEKARLIKAGFSERQVEIVNSLVSRQPCTPSSSARPGSHVNHQFGELA